MRQRHRVQHNEEGLVAIVVATLVMIILSLITLGFARVMQSEQRQALDRSLSTQAFYAAESAVNDVVRQIQDPNPATAFRENKDTCSDNPGNRFDGEVDEEGTARYSCLIVDQAPDSLEYTQGAIGTETSKVVPVRIDNEGGPAVPIRRINVSWEESSATQQGGAVVFPTCPSGATQLPPVSGWTARTGMIRLDVIPADTLNRDALINNTLSLFLYPCTGGGAQTSINYSAHNDQNEKGQIVNVACAPNDSPRDCELAIVMDTSPNALYYLRMRSIYRPSDMTIRLYDAPAAPENASRAIRGAQVEIDATGRVSDVLRRVKVRVPVNRSYQVPEFVIQTTDNICKQLQITPTPVATADNSACPL